MVVDNIVGVDDGVTSLGEFITKPIGEAGEGFVSGVIGILEGIGGLASIVPDMVAGSDIGGAIDRGGDKLRESLDINPEGLAGKGTEFVTQYLAPGLGAVNVIFANFGNPPCLSMQRLRAWRTLTSLKASVSLFNETTHKVINVLA